VKRRNFFLNYTSLWYNAAYFEGANYMMTNSKNAA